MYKYGCLKFILALCLEITNTLESVNVVYMKSSCLRQSSMSLALFAIKKNLVEVEKGGFNVSSY